MKMIGKQNNSMVNSRIDNGKDGLLNIKIEGHVVVVVVSNGRCKIKIKK